MEDDNENTGQSSKTTLLYDAVLQHYRVLCKYTQIVSKLLVLLPLLVVFTYLLSEDDSIKRK